MKIHYASLGKGPLIVMIHGFPDYWYTWRNQMEELSKSYQSVAVDLRGCNLSDKPKCVDNYDMKLLVGDIAALVKHLKREKAIIVWHDWGGAIAWSVAMALPGMTEKLIVCNLPNPRGLNRELVNNPEQKKTAPMREDFRKRGRTCS